MAGYFIFDVREEFDAQRMKEYRERVGPTVEKFGGRYLAIGGPFDVMEGHWRPAFPVIIEFPTQEAARRWYDSEDYKELKALRLMGSKSDVVFVAGLQ